MFNHQWFKDIFYFNKKERIFAVLLVFVIGGSLILPRFLAPKPQPLALRQDSALVLALDTLQTQQAKKQSYKRYDNHPGYPFEPSSDKGFSAGELFQFDPNTISLDQWLKLGLNERTSKTILNYRNKGGKFYKPEDLQKIWGMPEGFYERVKDYIAIASVQRNSYPEYNNSKPRYEREEKKPLLVDINEADTSAFIALPGIGSKLSARIVSFREKLGGFYAIEQVGETYGLPDSTFQKIKGKLQIDGSGIRKLNVNTATKDELKAHPYIRWNLANAIVEYRNQHGAFSNLNELKNIALIDNTTFERLVHYLSL